MDIAFLTAEQAAEQLQMHPRTVRKMLAEGKIPGMKVGGKEWRISAQILRDFIEGKVDMNPVANAAPGEQTGQPKKATAKKHTGRPTAPAAKKKPAAAKGE
jgi:excisionase family DNA binding protein